MKNHYSKEILKYLLFSGGIFTKRSPNRGNEYISNLNNEIKLNVKKKRSFLYSFNYLRKSGLIEVKRSGYDVKIRLTEKGKKVAGKYQIDDLNILIPKNWDGKWRIVVFDILDNKRLHRDTFRGKIKEFGFIRMQLSVWIYPYECKKEIELLREFLGINKSEIQVILAEKINNENYWKKKFKL